MLLCFNVIYDQTCRLFRVFSGKQKNPCGLNRCAQQSIKLIKEKNLLLRQTELSLAKTVRDSLQSLLGIGQCQLKVLHGSETRRWKIKQVNEAVLKNPYETGKSVLDPN